MNTNQQLVAKLPWWTNIGSRILQVIAIGVSATTTVAFLASFGTDILSSLVLGGLGLVVEALKVWAWSRVARHSKIGAWIFAIVISFLSILASSTYTAATISQNLKQASAKETANKVFEDQQSVLRTVQDSQTESLKILDAARITRREQVQSQLLATSDKAVRLAVEQQRLTGSSNTSGTLVDWVGGSGVSIHLISMIVMFLLSLIIEGGIGLLTLELGRTRQLDSQLLAQPNLEEVFIAALRLQHFLGTNGTVLSRSELKSQAVSERNWRRTVDCLARNGILERPKAGLPYRLSDRLRGQI